MNDQYPKNICVQATAFTDPDYVNFPNQRSIFQQQMDDLGILNATFFLLEVIYPAD